jgi:hypothetical protein
VGGDHGYAIRRSGSDWDIEFYIPRDSVDLITVSRFDNSDSSISGDFVTALEIQKRESDTVIWASTRPVLSPQFLGVSRSTDRGQTWQVSLTGIITWNLAIFNQHVWAATSSGLYHTTDDGVTWDRLDIADTSNADASEGTQFFPGTELLSVAQIDDTTLFVGSGDGLARSTDLGRTWSITRSFVGVGTQAAGGTDVDVFASPVPFSPVRGSRLRLHYKPETDANVRIEVFDFAMQKVATVLDGAFRSGRPGPDPFGTDHYYEEWDATNDKGERVATGVYFFRVEMNGQTKWGKLVILP